MLWRFDAGMYGSTKLLVDRPLSPFLPEEFGSIYQPISVSKKGFKIPAGPLEKSSFRILHGAGRIAHF